MDGYFLKEEIRSGFTVTEERKKIWAVELEILERFIEVCDKHNLKYFAWGGTLLGAVRHKGFIPWDDDIDIGMLRKDYNKLLRIANKEFTGKFFFQTVATDQGYFRAHAQIRNSSTTAILNSEMPQKMQFNQGIFIDIFPFDGIPNNAKKRNELNHRIHKIQDIIYRNAVYYRYENHSLKSKVLHFCVDKVIGKKILFKIHEKISSKYTNKSDIRGIGTVSFPCDDLIYPKEIFEDTDKIQFEYLEISVPKRYDDALRIKYGDYMKFVQGGSIHQGVFFDTETPYNFYIKDK